MYLVPGVKIPVSDNRQHAKSSSLLPLRLIPRKCSVKAKCASRRSREPDPYPTTEACVVAAQRYIVFQNEQMLHCPDLVLGLVVREMSHSLYSEPFGWWENCSASINLSKVSNVFLLNFSIAHYFKKYVYVLDTPVN